MKQSMKKNNQLKEYKDKKILITGGLGFIGSNLAKRLVKLGAHVSILDNLAPLYGGNYFNVSEIKNKIDITIGDIRDEKIVTKLIKNKDIVFNFAAQVSHTDSASIPYEDLDINCKGHLNVLECIRKHNPNTKILFSSSRLALGKIQQNPITETHPTEPLSLYGIHKLTAEKYYALYNRNYGIKTVIFRITNPYGERQQIKHNKYSIPGWFMRLAIERKTIQIFGDGKQLRDYIYIDDLVEAFLLAGINNNTNGKLYNCGFGKSIAFSKMVKNVIKNVGTGKIEYVPWPKNYELEETGHCETDISKLKNDTGWIPSINLEKGIKKMCLYYKKNFKKYI